VVSGLREYVTKHQSKKQKIQEYLGYCPVGFKEFSDLFQKPPPTKPKSIDPDESIFLNDIHELCNQLKQILLPNDALNPAGLITITGATDSSKSLITRGLIFLYLRQMAEKAFRRSLRRPHLVTFEDPIEEFYITEPAADFAPKNLEELEQLLATIYIDYTPREKRIDTDKLTAAIQDAKRQTPAVFFVGETRDPRDWVDLLKFSGSGHLVVTTSHAGSVVEAMTQIFRETETQTPSQRSEIARRILGIVNLSTLYPTASEIRSIVRVLLPAVWRSTPQSRNNLVADGLSSILPALDREEEIGYYGRTYFARNLLENPTADFKNRSDIDALRKEILRKAMEWDIGGV
jgi:Tfp pilus assembly pilus retraction ATPase PilT